MSEIMTFTPLPGSGIPREATPVKYKGTLTFTEPGTGKLVVNEIDLPIETNTDTLAWGLDFIRALRERPRLFQRIVRFFMGRYAWRELIGLRDSIEKHGWYTTFDYGIEGCEYHKDKVGNLWEGEGK